MVLFDVSWFLPVRISPNLYILARKENQINRMHIFIVLQKLSQNIPKCLSEQ